MQPLVRPLVDTPRSRTRVPLAESKHSENEPTLIAAGAEHESERSLRCGTFAQRDVRLQQSSKPAFVRTLFVAAFPTERG